MDRMGGRVLAALTLVGIAACNSPTSPGECRNGKDGLGRGPIEFKTFRCTSIGSDLQCQATSQDVGYCARPETRDVTTTATWISSNTQIGMFVVTPGRFNVIESGQVTIRAGPGYGPDAITYTVAPGSTPQRMADFGVIVENASNTQQRVAGATVEIVPEQGIAQTCQTDGSGFCRFWVFPTTIRARASRTGYLPTEGISPPPPIESPESLSYSQRLTLRMAPAQ
jgi:hypothetical protein